MSLDPGFSCPNRDGTLGKRGCAFCDPASFSPAAGDRRPIAVQLASGMEKLRSRGIRKFAAYFQPHTNTYAPLDILQGVWGQVLPFPDVVALCVGTRPDCAPEPVLDLLAAYQAEREVWIELGLQSSLDDTLRLLNRRHTAADFADAARRARAHDLLVCAHVILGLPGEDAGDEARTADFLSELRIDGVKLHHLAVVKGTPLEAAWRAGEFRVVEEAEYVDRAVDFVERLPPHTVLHRVAGDTPPDRLLAPRYNKGRAAAAIWGRLRSSGG